MQFHFPSSHNLHHISEHIWNVRGRLCVYEKICSRNFTQFLQFSIIFNIRIPCMDNDFSIIYLGIHNILQNTFIWLPPDCTIMYFSSDWFSEYFSMLLTARFTTSSNFHLKTVSPDNEMLQHQMPEKHTPPQQLQISIPFFHFLTQNPCRFHSIHSWHLNIQK